MCHCARTSRYHHQDSSYQNHSFKRCWTDTPKDEYTSDWVKEFDKGEWVPCAPGDWNEDNVKGYISAKEDFRKFLTTQTQAAYERGLQDGKARIRKVIEETLIDINDEHTPYWKLGAARFKKTILSAIDTETV